MALDQNAKYPVGTLPATAAYPEGSAVNSTAPGALDGYPLEKDQLNDRFGLEQALLKATGQAASGVPDTALVSQYLQGIIELAQGRATNYDESGAANAYILDVQTGQQAPAGLFDGQIFEFIAGNTNTVASTVNPVGTGVKNIVNTGIAGTITAGTRIRIKYRLSTTDFEIVGGIGYGQTWQDVKASRVKGTTYYNTTGKPIIVSITNTYSVSSRGILTVDSIEVSEFYGTGAENHAFTLYALIPPGSSYVASGTMTVDKWNELR